MCSAYGYAGLTAGHTQAAVSRSISISIPGLPYSLRPSPSPARAGPRPPTVFFTAPRRPAALLMTARRFACAQFRHKAPDRRCSSQREPRSSMTGSSSIFSVSLTLRWDRALTRTFIVENTSLTGTLYLQPHRQERRRATTSSPVRRTRRCSRVARRPSTITFTPSVAGRSEYSSACATTMRMKGRSISTSQRSAGDRGAGLTRHGPRG